MKGKILIADGSSAIRRNIAEVLIRDGHQVFEAGNGKEALKLLSNVTLDLMICDMNMSHYTGIEVVKKLSEFSAVRNIKRPPMVLMITDSGGGMCVEAKDAGVSICISKPFDPEQLLLTVRKLLG
jgi:CheY-like chemotaxis protein